MSKLLKFRWGQMPPLVAHLAWSIKGKKTFAHSTFFIARVECVTTFLHLWTRTFLLANKTCCMDLMGTLDFAILYFYSSFVQGDTKKTVINKSRITSKILFRLTQNFSYIGSGLCSRHLQSFKSVLQKLFVSLVLKKCAPNELPALQAHLEIGRASCRERV